MSGWIYTICKTGMGVLGWNEVHLESLALNVSIEVRHYPLFRERTRGCDEYILNSEIEVE